MEQSDDFRFPDTRHGLTRKVTLAGFELYLTVNPKPDGTPGEVFCKVARMGGTLPGMVQALVVTISTALKRGVAWEELSEKLRGMQFVPCDETCMSLPDGIARTIDDLLPELRELVRQQVGLQLLDFSADESKTKTHENRIAGHEGY